MLARLLATYKFKLIAGVAILVALAIALYASHQMGYGKGKNISALEIAKYQGQVSALTAQLRTREAIVNERVITQVVKDIAYIDRVEYVNRDIIKEKLVSRPVNVTEGFIYVHDTATNNGVLDPERVADGTPSNVSDAILAQTISENYAICKRNSVRFEGLQNWVRGVGEAADETNSNK